MAAYKAAHRHPFNQRCHRIGLPLLYFGWLGALVVNVPTGAAMTAAGAALQVLGHGVEGNRPALFGDRRSIPLAILWWFEQVGCPLHREAESDRT